MDVGYSLIGGSTPSLIRIFDAKQRAEHKLNAMIGDNTMSEDLHDLTPEQRDVVNCLTKERGLPLGIIAPAHLGPSADRGGLTRRGCAGRPGMARSACFSMLERFMQKFHG